MEKLWKWLELPFKSDKSKTIDKVLVLYWFSADKQGIKVNQC